MDVNLNLLNVKNTIMQSVTIMCLERQHKKFVYHGSSNGEIPLS